MDHRCRLIIPWVPILFRGLRAKAATDKAQAIGDMHQAQLQLGHESMGMTERYVRDRRGSVVSATG
jgi:integrase